MAFNIVPKNKEAFELGKPNGFWNALFVETPISKIVEAEYTDRGTIKYEHEGFVGGWFTEEEALKMHEILTEYVKTEEYLNHPYFSERHNQMESMLEFLPICGGFKRDW